jgi:hypothetical protein
MSGSMIASPAMERDDPLDRIECRGSEGMPLTPLPPLGGFGQPGSGSVDQRVHHAGGIHGGQEHAERPKMQETDSTMPLLSRTPSGRIRRESGMSPPNSYSPFSISHLSLALPHLHYRHPPQSIYHPRSTINYLNISSSGKQTLTPSANRRSNRNNLPTTRFRILKRLLLRSNRSTNLKRNACE